MIRRREPVPAPWLLVVFLPVLAGVVYAQPAGPDRRGYSPLTTIAEVRRVVRAEQPREAERPYALIPEWRFADGDEGVLFRSVDAVIELPGRDGRLLLVLDSRSSALHVFSAEGRRLRSLDLAGEGPGKLDHPADLVAMPDGTIGLLGASPARLVCIDAEGTWRGDLDLGSTARDLFLARHADSGGGRLLVAGQNTFAGRCFLAEFDCAAGAALDRVFEAPLESDLSRPRLVDRDGYLLEEKPWAVDGEGRLYLVVERNGPGCYQLEIHESGGSVIAVERPYPARRRSAREKDLARWRVLGPPAYAARFAGELIVDDREPDVREVVVRAAGGSGQPADPADRTRPGTQAAGRDQRGQPADPGPAREIWVRTSRGEDVLPEGGLMRYDVFGPEGEWLREAVLLAPEGWERPGAPRGPTPPCGWPVVHFLASDRVLLVRGQFEAEFPGFCAEESGIEIVGCEMR